MYSALPLMLWRERSSCRIFFITSLGQMRRLNVESQEGFIACLCSALKFKIIISTKHVTQKCLIASFYGRTEELLYYLTWVWLFGKWILCLLSGWIVDVLFSIYNWKNWKSVARIKSLGQIKPFFFPFRSWPSGSEACKGFLFMLPLLLSPHHCFLPSKTRAHIQPAQNWLVVLTDSDMSLSQGRT